MDKIGLPDYYNNTLETPEKKKRIKILCFSEISMLEEEIEKYNDDGWFRGGELIVSFDHKLQRTKYYQLMFRT